MANNFATVIIDGYNVLLTIAEWERVEFAPEDLRAGRSALTRLLDRWARLVDCSVRLVWDSGRLVERPVPEDTDRVKVSYVAPPAEADDWIATEAQRRVSSGEKITVVSRDKELWRRLPRGAERLRVDALCRDLLAIDGEPLRAAHIGASNVSITEEEFRREETIDTRLLPRRRPPSRIPERKDRVDKAGSAVHHPVAAAPRETNERDRAAVEAKKDRRRSKYLRAQARKALSRKTGGKNT